MSDTTKRDFLRAKEFSQFDQTHARMLPTAKDVVMAHQDRITDGFYAELAKDAIASKIIEGRVGGLKATHKVWMEELFNGEYGDAYFDRRYRIGQVHVTVKIEPYFVEVVTSYLRRSIVEVLVTEKPEAIPAVLAVLDLDAMVIIGAYQEDRLNRMSEVTGMSPSLLENLMSFSKWQ